MRSRVVRIALTPAVAVLLAASLAACAPKETATTHRAVPRGNHVAPGEDPLAAAADSVRSLYAPVACDTAFLNTGYTGADPEGAVVHTFACRGGTEAAHGYLFRDLAGGRTLVTGRVFRTANHQSRHVVDSIARAISSGRDSGRTCVTLTWPQSDVVRVWAIGAVSIRVVADTGTDDVTVERSVAAPDCDPSLFAQYPEFPYR